MKLATIVALLSLILIQSNNLVQGQNVYIIETEVGNIQFEVYPEKAPISVGNFKKYVDLKAFEKANFFRVVRMDNQPNNEVKIEVIQGNFTDSTNILASIAHETNDKTGILHKDGALTA